MRSRFLRTLDSDYKALRNVEACNKRSTSLPLSPPGSLTMNCEGAINFHNSILILKIIYIELYIYKIIYTYIFVCIYIYLDKDIENLGLFVIVANNHPTNITLIFHSYALESPLIHSKFELLST